MASNASIKRKAYELVKKGAFSEAAAAYARLSETGELQPYDLVVWGDLLLRGGNRTEALERYLEALQSYSEAGLRRSAIALAKKVHRLAPDMTSVHLRLGELYAAEGLSSEACLHYLEYLSKLDTRNPEAPEKVEETCLQLLQLRLPSYDIVDHVIRIAKEAGRDQGVAPGVLAQSQRAGEAGDSEAEARLRELARSLDPDVVAPVQSTTFAAETLDPGALSMSANSEEAPVLSMAEFDMERGPEPDAAADPAEVPAMDAEPETAHPVYEIDETDPSVVHLSSPTDEPFVSEVEQISETETEPESQPVEPVLETEPVSASEVEFAPGPVAPPPAELEAAGTPGVSPDGEAAEDPDAAKDRGFELLEQSEQVLAQREFMRAARGYFKLAQSRDAEDLYKKVMELDPNHLDALRGLAEIAHINGERAKMAHWGCELGDVLLAREMYSDAKVQFERVLAFDPENPKARSRVNRLNTIAGVRRAGYGPLKPAASELEGAKVSVAEEPTETQSAFDLSQVLAEFRTAMTDQLNEDDGQSHYDLGMTYKEMGLFEEAAHEFEVAALNDSDRARSLELLGECYLLMDRNDDALATFDQILVDAEPLTAARMHLHRGRIFEAIKEWDQAEQAYFDALELDGDLLEAAERLEALGQRSDREVA